MWGIFFFYLRFCSTTSCNAFRWCWPSNEFFETTSKAPKSSHVRRDVRDVWPSKRPGQRPDFFSRISWSLRWLDVCVCVFSRDLSTSLLILFFNNHIIYIDRSFWKLIDRYVCDRSPAPKRSTLMFCWSNRCSECWAVEQGPKEGSCFNGGDLGWWACQSCSFSTSCWGRVVDFGGCI